MKIGDQKQAIALGVVAVFAVGMLGKTAFGAFGSSNNNQPVVVKDIGGVAGPASPEQAKPDADQIDPRQAESTKTPLSAVNMTSIKRDAFEKPFVPEKTKQFSQYSRPPRNQGNESMTESGGPGPMNPMVGDINSGNQSLPNATKPTEDVGTPTKPKQPKPEEILARFDGYVDAGSPMGIISVNGKSFSISKGDAIGFGYKVDTISNTQITIRKGKLVKTISIGKETRI